MTGRRWRARAHPRAPHRTGRARALTPASIAVRHLTRAVFHSRPLWDPRVLSMNGAMNVHGRRWAGIEAPKVGVPADFEVPQLPQSLPQPRLTGIKARIVND